MPSIYIETLWSLTRSYLVFYQPTQQAFLKRILQYLWPFKHFI